MIREFTTDEKVAMTNVITQIDNVIAQMESDYSSTNLNPLNHLLETQRNALTRSQNLINQTKILRTSLNDSIQSVIDSLDTDRYNSWMDSAAAALDTSQFKIQIGYSSTLQMAQTVGGQTVKDIEAKLPLVAGTTAVVLLAIAGLYVFILFGRKA